MNSQVAGLSALVFFAVACSDYTLAELDDKPTYDTGTAEICPADLIHRCVMHQNAGSVRGKSEAAKRPDRMGSMLFQEAFSPVRSTRLV